MRMVTTAEWNVAAQPLSCSVPSAFGSILYQGLFVMVRGFG